MKAATKSSFLIPNKYMNSEKNLLGEEKKTTLEKLKQNKKTKWEETLTESKNKQREWEDYKVLIL